MPKKIRESLSRKLVTIEGLNWERLLVGGSGKVSPIGKYVYQFIPQSYPIPSTTFAGEGSAINRLQKYADKEGSDDEFSGWISWTNLIIFGMRNFHSKSLLSSGILGERI